MGVKNKNDVVSLTLKGDKITADKLRRSISDFNALLDEVSAEVTKQKKSINWFVTVKKGGIVFSPVYVGKDRISAASRQVFGVVKEGIEKLERKSERPDYFNDKALELVQNLATLSDSKPHSLEGINIKFGSGKAKSFTSDYVSNIDSILGFESDAYGSVEGKLEAISGRGGLRFNVYDSVHDNSVRCSFSYNHLEKAREAFEKRVHVFGSIKYSLGGFPRSIKVEELKIFPEKKSLPSVFDVCGILSANDG